MLVSLDQTFDFECKEPCTCQDSCSQIWIQIVLNICNQMLTCRSNLFFIYRPQGSYGNEDISSMWIFQCKPLGIRASTLLLRPPPCCCQRIKQEGNQKEMSTRKLQIGIGLQSKRQYKSTNYIECYILQEINRFQNKD